MQRATILATLALATCAAIVVVVLFHGEAGESSEIRNPAERAAAETPAATATTRAERAMEMPTREEQVPSTGALPGAAGSERAVVVMFTSSLDGAILTGGIRVEAKSESKLREEDDVARARPVTRDGPGSTEGPLLLSPGHYLVNATIGDSVVGSSDIDVAPGSDPQQVTMSVRAFGPVLGQVIGSGGEPIASASIALRVIDQHGVGLESTGRFVADAKGAFSIPALPLNPKTSMTIAPEHPNFARGADVAILRGNGTVELHPTLRLGDELPQVVGRVVDADNSPRVGATVVIRLPADSRQRWHAATDDAGAFLVRGLAPGTYSIEVERRCLASGPVPFVVDAAKSRCDVGTIVTSEPTHTLRLRVVDASGVPLSGVLVIADGILSRSNDEGRTTARTCSTDAVEVFVNVPVGETIVTVRAGRFAADDAEHEIVPRYGAIRLRLRDRSAPDGPIKNAPVQFVARCAARESRGQRSGAGLLVIAEPDMTGTWRVDLDVKGFAPTSVDVVVDEGATSAPLEVWLARKE